MRAIGHGIAQNESPRAGGPGAFTNTGKIYQLRVRLRIMKVS